ncbi:MAG: histidine kinase [Lewinellaceae bacterium]|nr:histidine kinase [Phaeodactylibacter sp.]MCB0611877.1 histidine kinase [Phaeodactylibacter sp.]MCB9349006.1 histidine kinase [Lewinellaceae bacterium]
MRALFFILSFGFLMPASRGQSPFFVEHPLGEIYRDVKVSLVYEASDGFLWFGSSHGLFRYDGQQYHQYLAPDSLTNNKVAAIFEDKGHRFWAGYEDGRIFYMETPGHLQLWQPEEGLPTARISGFGQRDDGLMWLATYGEGVYYFDGRRMYNINTEDGLLGNDVYVMVMDDSGQAWVGTDGGISICSVRDGKKNVRNITRADGLPDEIVRAILPDEKGNFWIGTYDKGICYYDTKEQVFSQTQQDWAYGPVSSLELFQGLELWVGTEGQGVFRYTLPTRQLAPIEFDGLAGAKVFSLHADCEGNIWVVNNNKPVYAANRQFEFIEGGINNIQAVLASQNGQLWVGCQDGLYVYDEQKRSFSLYKKENVISLYESSYGVIWAGTFGNGLFCIDPSTGKERHLTEADGLSNGSILDIDGKGPFIWLATLGGVTEFICEKNIFEVGNAQVRRFDENSGLGTNFIYTVFLDSQGRTWFGTDGEGLSYIDNGRIESFAEADSIPLRAIYSITEDKKGHIWFSSGRQGVFEWDGEHFQHLSVKEGIRDMAITSLASDSKGNILIVHPSGIDILNPVTKHIIYYDDEIGLQNVEPNLNAICHGKDGVIWIGAQNRLIKYTALNEQLCIHPRTSINSVAVFLEPIDFRQQKAFSYSENNLVFEYVGLWYTAPSKVRYRYMLEGFDLDWIYSRDRQAIYSNLPPGSYTFKLAATENEAFDDEPLQTYGFTVKAPYWRQWWFLLLCVALGVAGSAWLIRQRDKRLEREATLKREKIESQFEALKSQINPHFLFNSFNTLITIIEENPEMAVEFVEKLSDFYRSILQYRETEVISLQEEIELVQNYAFLLKKRFGDNLSLTIANGDEQAFLPPLTLQILVENAVKHNIISKARPLNIEIRAGDGYITVRNNLQKKIAMELSTGFGLQSIVNRYALLADRPIRIEEGEAYFSVSIPIIKNGKE